MVRNVVGFAVVVGFEGRQFDAVFFDQIGELVEEFTAARGVRITPFGFVRKSALGGCYSLKRLLL